MKGAAGAAFIITPPCASQPMASSCVSEAFFPLKAASKAKTLRYLRTSGREGIPIRPERHNPLSIISIRRRLTVDLARRLPRCPCCQQVHARAVPPNAQKLSL
jgi:hypothetical protein